MEWLLLPGGCASSIEQLSSSRPDQNRWYAPSVGGRSSKVISVGAALPLCEAQPGHMDGVSTARTRARRRQIQRHSNTAFGFSSLRNSLGTKRDSNVDVITWQITSLSAQAFSHMPMRARRYQKAGQHPTEDSQECS